jgi:hypothetical protein
MDMANNNPDEDIITFTPGLTVNAGTCPNQTLCTTPSPEEDCFFLKATESVTFDGQGALIEGRINYISPDGIHFEGQACPDKHAGDLILAETPGFIKVGIDGQSNAGITVTVRDLDLAELAAVARIEQDASLVIEDSSIERIYAPSALFCDMRAVLAQEGASFTARGTDWNFIWNDVESFFGFIFPGAIAGVDAADLTIESSEFNQASTAGLISWLAPAGRTVNIVSSRFSDTGGIVVQGGATTNIVNSIWATADGGTNTEDRIVNDSTGEMNLIASTLLFASPNCDDACQGLDESRGLVHRRPNAGTINLIQSAIGISFPDDIDTSGYKEVLDPDTSDPNPPTFGFSADPTTWIQPTGVNTPGQGGQDAATLQTVTNQPGLLTAAPGLRTSPDIGIGPVARAEPLVPGELIDRIADSACDQSNELMNPVDDSCITEDALGNPRVDGNDSRNIGAVQLQEAPHLSVVTVGSGTVDLSWTKPRDLVGLCGYRLTYRESATTSDTSVDILDPDTLSNQVTGLTNGIEYEFQIEGLVDCPDTDPSGFPSNLVTATPISGAVLDCGAAYPSLGTLWPPNHKLVPIDVLGITDPDGGPITVSVDGIFQDEPVNGGGDGNTSPDATGIGAGTASVRAERAGHGNGRVYTLFFTATNDGGAQCNGSVEVAVPKSRKRDAVNDGPLFDSTKP